MKKEIVRKIIEADKIALFGHKRPDGDSMSSSYGLARAIKKRFPEKEVVWVVDFDYIKENYPNKVVDMSFVRDEIDESFITIVGDVSGSSRIDHFEEWQKGKTKICFDHHQNEADCDPDIFWHEPTWPASTLQAIEIVKDLKVELDEGIALDLLVGILTDTGFFRFSLGNPVPPRYYADMLEYVSDERMSEFFNAFSERSKEDIEITSMILSKVIFEGRVAYAKCSREDVEKYGAHKIKSKVNLIANIKGYPIWALFSNVGDVDGLPWEGSLRSNGPQINNIASNFNGGGHIRAAGCKLSSEEQIDQLLKELNK